MIAWAWRQAFAFLRFASDLFDPAPYVSRRRAWEAWDREEMDRHPVDRVEPWHGLDRGHYALGRRVEPGDIRKRPVFGK